MKVLVVAVLLAPFVAAFVNPTVKTPVSKQSPLHHEDVAGVPSSSKLTLYRDATIGINAPYGMGGMPNAFSSTGYGPHDSGGYRSTGYYGYGGYGRGYGYGGYGGGSAYRAGYGGGYGGGYGRGYGYGSSYVNNMNFSPYVGSYGTRFGGRSGYGGGYGGYGYGGGYGGGGYGGYNDNMKSRYHTGFNGNNINAPFTYGNRVNTMQDVVTGSPFMGNNYSPYVGNNNVNNRYRSYGGIGRSYRGGGDLSERAKFPDPMTQLKIQGDTLKTWSFQTSQIDRVHIMMSTEGRPLQADVELWQGPDNKPQKVKVYCEDGAIRPFNCVIETPGDQNTVGIKNTNTVEFPLHASVEAEVDGSLHMGLREAIMMCADSGIAKTVQGKAVYTKPFDPAVQSVQVLLQTDGRPLNARVELLQGPNNSKQVLEIYAEDGYNRPFFVILETPEEGSLVRIVNTATLEFPLMAVVEPYVVDPYYQRQWQETGLFNVD